MKEVLRTTDPTKIAYAMVLLQGEDIAAFQMDVHMSVLEGSVGILPRRIMVADAEADRARRVLSDLGLTDDGWEAGQA
ncbi:DUF2007 domain-containing protein [Frigidibacter sp. MR17.14]|uniref:putative signal transducing protein n=1 Tax=Frigidibacter sp. MR17.14 TaxID=3126509 RepID=UPI003012F0DA